MEHRQSELLRKIEKEAVGFFWEKCFGGKAYGSNHLFRVNAIAKHLWEKEGGDEFILLAGAWIHDVSLAEGNDHDSQRVAAFTRDFLARFKDLSADELDRIVECAMGHEVGCTGLSLEAKIVHDADVVDKSGILGVVRHAWKMTNLTEGRILNRDDDPEKIQNHLRERQVKVFAATARDLVKNLSRSRDLFFKDKVYARKTIAWISRLAQRSITSDEIAEIMVEKDDHESLYVLKDQLSCRFLK